MLLSVASRPPMSDIEFTILVTDRLHDLRRYARRLCKRIDAAEDLVLETIAQAWATRHQFNPGAGVRMWLFRILRGLFRRRAIAA